MIDIDYLKRILAESTPAPWNLCAHLRFENENGCGCGYRGVIYGGDTDYAVCQTGHDTTEGKEGLDTPRYPRHTEIANARLIALAPMMAEMIIKMKEGK